MENREKLLKVYHSPQLKEPFLVAAGPGTANVGLRVVSYLVEKVRAEFFAEIEPGDFFIPPYSFEFQNGLIELSPLKLEAPSPKNRFYYWKSTEAHDLLFFLGDTHPLPGKVPELAKHILDIAGSFDIKRLFVPGAFLTNIHHLGEPTIYGAVTDSSLLKYLDSYQIAAAPPMNIAHNLNAWLLGMAKKMNLDGISLVSEIPFYNPEGPNIRACQILIETLCQMLNLEGIDLLYLHHLLAEEEAQLEQKLAELRQSTDKRVIEFIQYLEELENESKERKTTHFPTQEELPESLKYIEELYKKAEEDKSMVPQLKTGLDHLEQFDRLLILRKYGDELLKLLGEQT
jgi:hypothetical protein